MKAANLGTASWWAPVWATALAAELAQDRPDAVVVDYYLLGALAAAEQAGLATGVLVHNTTYPGPLPGLPPPNTGFGLQRHALDRLRDRAWASALRFAANRNALPSLNRARTSLGLAPLLSVFDQYQAADRVLILSSRAFDFQADRLPANVRYVGTPFDEAPSTQWRSPWPEDDQRPLLLVSLSTLAQGQGPLLHRVLEAVGMLSVRALVTLGPSLNPAEFKAPPNAILETFIPHAAVLPRAAALVTQCGLSSVSKALAHGVPLVCIPLVADQPDNAARVVAAGAGIRLDPKASPRQIATAIDRVLTDESYRDGSRRMAAIMSPERGAEAAVAELEAMATETSPSFPLG
jgi:MGT family glycosyltransferase